MLRQKLIIGISLALAALVPNVAGAYLNPYDVLLSEDLFLPASPRDAEDRVLRQQDESSARRDREFEEEYLEQHPPAPVYEEEFFDLGEEELHGAAPSYEVDRNLVELLRTLERIEDNKNQAQAEREIRQQAFLLLQEEGLHSGAPTLPSHQRDLAPTGPGAILALLAFFIAGMWTLKKARYDDRMIKQ